jgi:predicted ribosome quality control (RQC) complex YloA/Tae2 family protein
VVPLPSADDSSQIVNIRLELKKDVHANAQHYYERAKRMREKRQGAERALEQTVQKLEDHREVGPPPEIEKPKALSKHFWFENYRWFISTDGNIVVAGRDATTNDREVKKYLKT